MEKKDSTQKQILKNSVPLTLSLSTDLYNRVSRAKSKLGFSREQEYIRNAIVEKLERDEK